jgi:Zn-dependent metalloprotease
MKSVDWRAAVKKWFLTAFVVFAALAILPGAGIDPGTGWRDFVSYEGHSWRAHFTDHQTVKALYGSGSHRYNSPQDAAYRLLNDHAAMLGIDAGADLRLESVETNALGAHFTYRQYSGGLPVVNAVVAIHVNGDNRLIAASSSFISSLKEPRSATNTVADARVTAVRFLQGRAVASPGRLMALPMGGRAVPAWRIEVDSTRLSAGSWLLYVDAASPNVVLRMLKTHATINGKGNIWLQNPVVTPTRAFQTFLNMDGSTSLSGKFAKAFDANFMHDVGFLFTPADYTTAKDPARNYDYPSGDARLTEAMAYFHMNRVHDQWQSFGFQTLNARAPAFVNVAEEDGGAGYDNAYYTRSSSPQFRRTGLYVFGAGTDLENLGLDCDVYYHEYGHGVLDHVKPGFFEVYESNYPGSFHEGFGDISDAAITGNSKIGEWGLRLKATKQFVGRDVQNTNRFPQNVIDPRLHKSEVHFTGLIAGGSWWDLSKTIGSATAQRILFESLKMIPDDMNFFDLRDAMLTADQNQHGSANHTAILDAFTRHGLGGADPGQPGSFNFTALKAGLYNFDTGKISIKTTFKPGDTIIVLANYNATNVTPGYNFIPEVFDYHSPSGSNADVYFLVDDAVNGSHSGINGAAQGLIFTDTNTTTGNYSVAIQSRLGGSTKLGVKRTVKFTLK